MKKIRFAAFALTVVLAVLFVPVAAGRTAEAAEWGFASPDECYEEGVFLLAEEEADYELLEKNPLHNHYLDVTGYEYIFRIGADRGYMLVPAIESSDGTVRFQATEVFPKTESPFAGAEGDRVYMCAANYVIHKDGVFFDKTSGAPLSQEELDFLFEEGFGFRGGISSFDFVSEAVPYAGRSVVSKQVKSPNYVPTYMQTDIVASCVPIAGANLLAYYQMLGLNTVYEGSVYEYYAENGVYQQRLAPEGAVAKKLITNVAAEMKTHPTNGTTVANFKSGISGRAKAQGYFISYDSFMSGLFNNNFDVDKFKSYMDSYQRPAVFFLTKLEAGTWPFILEGNNKDTLRSNRYTANHAVMVSGYKTVRYYRYEEVSVWDPVWYNPFRYTSQTQYLNFKTVEYAYASLTIAGFKDVGFLMLGAYTNVADAMGVRIYT